MPGIFSDSVAYIFLPIEALSTTGLAIVSSGHRGRKNTKQWLSSSEAQLNVNEKEIGMSVSRHGILLEKSSVNIYVQNHKLED